MGILVRVQKEKRKAVVKGSVFLEEVFMNRMLIEIQSVKGWTAKVSWKGGTYY